MRNKGVLDSQIDDFLYKATGKIDDLASVDKLYKSVDDILEGAKPGKVNLSKQYLKVGGFDEAVKDFNSLGLKNIKELNTQYGRGYYGELLDGTKVIVRPGSSYGVSTLEIKYNKPIKIRYE